jgi:hypothetical protein
VTSLPEVPEWLIDQVAESLPINPYPGLGIQEQMRVRRAVATSIAVQVWHLGFHAGAAWGMSIANQTKYMVVTAEQMEKIKNDPNIQEE